MWITKNALTLGRAKLVTRLLFPVLSSIHVAKFAASIEKCNGASNGYGRALAHLSTSSDTSPLNPKEGVPSHELSISLLKLASRLDLIGELPVCARINEMIVTTCNRISGHSVRKNGEDRSEKSVAKIDGHRQLL
jgi:hypothetical protein